MVFVEGGTFQMGSNDGDNDEKPVHKVEVSSFWMGKYLVTQEQWLKVMGNNPSYFNGCDQCPVENVSWYDIQKFLMKLNQMTGQQYRLPTEAGWEFSARGGNKSLGYRYAGGNDIGEVAWYWKNGDDKTHPVGQKKPNELGLYDMTGNVWEWCQDWYGEYPDGPQADPTGPEYGASRVQRGGAWDNHARNCRSAYRLYRTPDERYSNRGFRLVAVPYSASAFICPDCKEPTYYTPEDIPDKCDNCGLWTQLRMQSGEPTYDPKSRHYDAGGIETLNVIRAKLTPEQYQGFLMGNLIKYILRANFKEDFARDIDKAARYAKWLNEFQGDR